MALGEAGIGIMRRNWLMIGIAVGTAIGIVIVSALIICKKLRTIYVCWLVVVLAAPLLWISDAVAPLLVFLVYTLLPLSLLHSVIAALLITIAATCANILLRPPFFIREVVSIVNHLLTVFKELAEIMLLAAVHVIGLAVFYPSECAARNAFRETRYQMTEKMLYCALVVASKLACESNARTPNKKNCFSPYYLGISQMKCKKTLMSSETTPFFIKFISSDTKISGAK
jgi:hypothetical protein